VLQSNEKVQKCHIISKTTVNSTPGTTSSKTTCSQAHKISPSPSLSVKISPACSNSRRTGSSKRPSPPQTTPSADPLTSSPPQTNSCLKAWSPARKSSRTSAPRSAPAPARRRRQQVPPRPSSSRKRNKPNLPCQPRESHPISSLSPRRVSSPKSRWSLCSSITPSTR